MRRHEPVRRLLEELIAEHPGDLLAATVAPALAVRLRNLAGEPHRVPRPLNPAKSRVTRLKSDIWSRYRPVETDYTLVDGCLFEAGSLNHRRVQSPIMERLGEPTTQRSRAALSRTRALSDRAMSLADWLIRTAAERQVELPVDALTVNQQFLIGSRALAYAEAVVGGLRPRVAVVSSMHGKPSRATVYTARATGAASVYIPHAPMIRDVSLNDLPVDFAGLRGEREASHYAEHGVGSDRLDVVGNPSLDAQPMPDRDDSLPPVLAPSPATDEQTRILVEFVHAAVGERLIVSPHPRSDVELFRSLAPGAWEFWSGRTYELLRKGPPAVIQHSSGIALEALQLGIPTIELAYPDKQPNYPAIEEPHVHFARTPAELESALSAAAEESRDPARRAELRNWAEGWNSPCGGEAAARGAALIRRAADEGPLSAPIWDAWLA